MTTETTDTSVDSNESISFVAPCSLCDGKESPDENCPECDGDGAVLDSESLLLSLKDDNDNLQAGLAFIASKVEALESAAGTATETAESLASRVAEIETAVVKVKQNSVATLMALFHIAKGDAAKAESFLRVALGKNGVSV